MTVRLPTLAALILPFGLSLASGCDRGVEVEPLTSASEATPQPGRVLVDNIAARLQDGVTKLREFREEQTRPDWKDPAQCGGFAGPHDTPALWGEIQKVDGVIVEIAILDNYDRGPIPTGISMPILGAGDYKGDAIVQEILPGGRVVRGWLFNSVAGTTVAVGDGAFTRSGFERMSELSRICSSLTIRTQSAPDLSGAVCGVNGRLVDLRIDHNPEGVVARPGYAFAIHAGNNYKGDAVVCEVTAGGIVHARVYNPVKGTTIRCGDKAATPLN